MSEDDVLYDAEEARLLAEMFSEALTTAQKGAENADVLIVMDVDGEMFSYTNTTRPMSVFLAQTHATHAALLAYREPVEEADDE